MKKLPPAPVEFLPQVLEKEGVFGAVHVS